MNSMRIDLRIPARTLALAAAFALSVWARPISAAGPISAAEASQGWIALFDGESLFGWNQLGDAAWRVEDGAMVCDSGTGGWIATTSQFTDYELRVKLRVKNGMTSGLALRAGLEGHPSENGSSLVFLGRERSGNDWIEVRILAEGSKVTATVNGGEEDATVGARRRGYVGIQFHTYHNRHENKIEVAEVKLRPLAMKPLFNGRDLTGWNIIPGRKSVFAVLDGAINIKNGNGQIETAGVYKDFLLQLDIISNGEHLNSGVFYRTPPGQFWMGYESQIRNQFINDDRTQPYDFGTGGNYGNQNARKVVSSDHEWFTKTIVANGNHTAIWIDGYQVSDFLDTRPVSPQGQGKTGYVNKAGTINLQGHDPTTDLSFKNILVQEYPE